LTANRETSRN